ncbi:MAG: hypothetical protein ABIO70_34725 [Pseudomonadota bacterium]
MSPDGPLPAGNRAASPTIKPLFMAIRTAEDVRQIWRRQEGAEAASRALSGCPVKVLWSRSDSFEAGGLPR